MEDGPAQAAMASRVPFLGLALGGGSGKPATACYLSDNFHQREIPV
jgi:hypothetical protein